MADVLPRFEPAVVHRFAHDAIAVSGLAGEAVRRLGPPVHVLVHTPCLARFLRLDADARACDEDGASFDLAQAFEARFFSTAGEIFWRRTGSELGRAVLTAESELAPPSSEWSQLQSPTFRRAGTRLLWGKFDAGLPNGWSRLSSPRIGPISVPVAALAPGGTVALAVVEYARGCLDGNVVPAGERLAGFK